MSSSFWLGANMIGSKAPGPAYDVMLAMIIKRYLADNILDLGGRNLFATRSAVVGTVGRG